MSDAAARSRLPLAAQLKLGAIIDLQEAAQYALHATAAKIASVQRALDMATDAENAPEIQFELQRLKDLQDQQRVRAAERARSAAQLMGWVRTLPVRASFQMAREIAVRPAKGETPLQAVQRVREQIAALTSEKQKVIRASPPRDILHAMVREYVLTLAQQARPSISYDDRGVRVNFADHLPVAMLAWVDPDRLIKRLCAEIDALPKTELSLNLLQKNERLAEIKAKLFGLERQEEALIDLASEDGQEIARRPNADPTAVLGVIIKQAVMMVA